MLERIEKAQGRMVRISKWLCSILWVLIISFTFFRLYIWSCYRQFTALTIAKMHNVTFPVAEGVLKDTVATCKGIDTMKGTACNPNFDQVLYVCQNVGTADLVGQKRPVAFGQLIYQWFGLSQVESFPCFHGICKFRNSLVEHEKIVYLGFALIIFAIIYTICHYRTKLRDMNKTMYEHPTDF